MRVAALHDVHGNVHALDRPEFHRTDYHRVRVAEAVRASGRSLAAELADDNILRVPSPAEVHATWGAV